MSSEERWIEQVESLTAELAKMGEAFKTATEQLKASQLELDRTMRAVRRQPDTVQDDIADDYIRIKQEEEAKKTNDVL